jgi:hypothetical protein
LRRQAETRWDDGGGSESLAAIVSSRTDLGVSCTTDSGGHNRIRRRTPLIEAPVERITLIWFDLSIKIALWLKLRLSPPVQHLAKEFEACSRWSLLFVDPCFSIGSDEEEALQSVAQHFWRLPYIPH